MFKEKRKFISRLSRRTKLAILGLIISFFSIFIVNISVIIFCVFYLIGVFLIFISAFIGIEKFNKNTIGEIISRLGLILIILGIFYPMGIIKNPNLYYIQISGTFLMLIGISSKSKEKKKGS
ncbi:hypothetical protein [Bacillus sp. 1P02SD]|uniref:hypothetical protein n=1 Tax=Bacillus sp. 1P02SD TaxID=3132264 RepID=UPI0039A30C0F